MKAVIVEARTKKAAALSADGQVIKIKNRNFSIGQVIEIEKKQAYGMGRIVTRVAAAAAIITFCSASAFAYYTPYSYVSLDVNPSFEYAVNYFDIVLSVRSLSDDNILDETELKMLNNKNIQHAVAETVEQIKKSGYFDAEEDNSIFITASSNNKEKSDKLVESLQQSVKTGSEESKNIEINTSSIKKEIVEEAKDLGVSAGKLNLVKALEESAEDGEIDRDEWLQKPVKEIMEAIKENKKEEKERIKDSKIEEKEKVKENKNEKNNNNKKSADKAQANNGGQSQKNAGNNGNGKKDS